MIKRQLNETIRQVFILLLLTGLTVNSYGQLKSYILSQYNGDTLNRVDAKGLKQGPWVERQEAIRNNLGSEAQGYYEDDVKVGKWVTFSLIGDKMAEENYRWGHLNGICKYYTRAGILQREESWRAIDPKKKFDTVNVYDLEDPTRVIRRVVVKVESHSVKHGIWKYYDTNYGMVAQVEKYWMDKLQQEGDEPGVTDDLKPIDIVSKKTAAKDSTVDKSKIPKPDAVLLYEKKNKGKKIKSRDGNTGL